MSPAMGGGLSSNRLARTVPPSWADWWRALGQHAGELEGRYPARNLLLDEQIEPARATSYASYLEALPAPVWPANTFADNLPPHKRYVAERLFKNHGGELPKSIEFDEWSCPETFLHISPGSPFLEANLDLKLVRVEGASAMAARIGIDPATLLSVASEALRGTRAASESLDLYLETLADKSLVRPEFATFEGDLEEYGIFAATDWADRLRDVLGLVHYDPLPDQEIDILVFTYPLRDLPMFVGQPSTRPLVPPVALESGFNAAFCPSPAGGLTGHTVDLSGNVPAPRREVLHPTLQYQTRHLFRVGKIRRAVERDNLGLARALHLAEIQKMYNRPDYATSTDSDILS